MDLGSLELQIFVSLTVVLGGAFIALICDYLKGNNEQLREHNIELRVRKEEQERRMLLDPATYLNQVAPAVSNPERPAPKVEADDYYGDAESQPANHRRAGRPRGGRRGRNARPNGENFSDWVRPEVFARVARQAESDVACSQDIRVEMDAPRPEPQLQPLNAADRWDIRAQLPSRGKAVKPERPAAAPEPAAEPPKEVEQVAQTQTAVQAPGVILRPLTVPALKLEEEIQRVAEVVVPPPAPAPMPVNWSSPLLEEVIAASAERVTERPVAVMEEPVPAVADEVLQSGYDIAAREYPMGRSADSAELEYLRGMAAIELPVAQLRLTEEPVLTEVAVAEEAEPLELPALVALDELPVDPPPFWMPPVAAEEPIAEFVEPEVIQTEIEETKEPEVEHHPDLILPAGMQDLATWNRLLELPNPVSGFVVMVKVEATENTNAPAAESIPELVGNLMQSLLRDGDFGCQIGETEWVFIYGHDTTGLNQRRVGMVSEKLWDFKLRNINLTNVTFKWGAVDVKSEPLLASIDAARSRLYATRRNRMLPGAHGVGPRWVVNG